MYLVNEIEEAEAKQRVEEKPALQPNTPTATVLVVDGQDEDNED